MTASEKLAFKRLKQAVTKWTKSDYYSKRQTLLGWTHAMCAHAIVEAEDELREALTGHKGLDAAAWALGCKKYERRVYAPVQERKRAKVRQADPALRPRAKPKMAKRVKARSIWD